MYLHHEWKDGFPTLDQDLFHGTFVTRRTTRSSTRHWGRELIPGAMHRLGATLDLEDRHLSNSQLREILENPKELGYVRKCNLCKVYHTHMGRYDKSEIHEVELCNNNLTSFRESGLTDFVRNCRSLVRLCTYRCRLGPYERGSSSTSLAAALEDIAHFAHAIGSSNVRHLEIGSHFGAVGLRTFLENLPPSRIKRLDISITGIEWSPEEHAIVECIMQFLSDPAKSRNITYYDWAYDFSYQARMYMMHMILGSYDTINKESEESSVMLHSQKPNFSVCDFCWGIWGASLPVQNNSITCPSWMGLSPNSDVESLDDQIRRRNNQLHYATWKEATRLLCVTRILGCRVRVLGERQGLFPFFKLPSELRIYILRMVAPHLDDTQFVNVLSWACCAATIGHCCRRRVDVRPPMEATLDVPQWDWNKCTTCESHTIPVSFDVTFPADALSFIESTETNVASVDVWY